MNQLYKLKIHSVIIEGGTITIQQFINSNCWDEARVFESDKLLNKGILSPVFDNDASLVEKIDTDNLFYFFNQ